MRLYFTSCLLIVLSACNSNSNEKVNRTEPKFPKGSFGYDLNFINQHQKDLVVLRNDDGAKVIISPAYQGRVMTSSARGDSGKSFGWINYDLIASGKPAEHINAVGGEERFWLGPEGGQFSIYFKKGDEFIFENWFVPKEIDTEPFDLISHTDHEVDFEKKMHLENYSGNKFDLTVHRNIRLLEKRGLEQALGVQIPAGVEAVGFESDNSITNEGTSTWDKKFGMLSIWILSMLNASDQTTVAIPFRQGDPASLGKIVTDDYFGKVPGERLKIGDSLILFKADGNFRSKIGISPRRALPIAASFDTENNVLTIAQFSLPDGATDYVNSLWELQDDPFSGDAVNSYNDGPIDGKQMGKFYEIESSSPAAALAPGKSIHHLHRTIHLTGSKEKLDLISKKLLGTSIDKIQL